MGDGKVRRIRKRRAPQKRYMALLSLLLVGVVTLSSAEPASSVTVDVPEVSNTGSGWGDASDEPAASTAAESTPAPTKTLTLETAKTLAYATSIKLDDLDEKYELKVAAYENAVKAAAITREYVKHFHWRFLFSFDLPRDLTFEEIRETAYEPKEALEEANSVKKDMDDLKFDLNEKVTDLYISIYKGRQSVALAEERLVLANDKVSKVAAMVATGEKNQEDLNEAQQEIKDIESAIAADTTTANAACKQLGKLIGLVDAYGNVTDPTLSEYTLESPYNTKIIDELDRKDLDYLKEYTLDHDSDIAEARSNNSLAYLDVTTVYQALSDNMKYNDMQIIAPYYRDVLAGRTINKRDLKQANKKFLAAVDTYWNGDYKIGFWPILFKIPKVWFKGKSDGTWYMQDDPNALFDTILEYYNTSTELKSASSDKEDTVEGGFNTYIGLRNTYTLLAEQRKEKEASFNEAKVEYRIGEIDAEEYNSILDNYESLQNQELESLTTFSQYVNSFNRMTCGALDKLLNGEDFENEYSAQLVVANSIPGASYYIIPKYDELTFEMGICVPDDFKYNISDFELWCDNIQIGERTATGSVIKHLMKATANVEQVVVRLYDGEEFLADCEIDPGILQGPLYVIEYDGNTQLENQVGVYEFTENEDDTTVTLKLMPNTIENMKYFVVYDTNGVAVGSEELRKVDEGIKYLKALENSLDQVTIKCYDADQNYLYDASLNIYKRALIKKV